MCTTHQGSEASVLKNGVDETRNHLDCSWIVQVFSGPEIKTGIYVKSRVYLNMSEKEDWMGGSIVLKATCPVKA